MSRPDWASALIAALRADDLEPVYLVDLHFDSGTERLHTSLGSLSFGGNTYTGAGSLARIGVVEEGTELSPYAMEIGLSGVDQDMLDIALAESYFMRLMTVYLGAIGTDGQLVSDPGELFFGFMMNMDVGVGDPDEGDSITLTCESEAAVIERSSNLRYTETQLQTDYPGDLGLQYQDQMVDARPQWRGNQQVLAGTRPSRVPSPHGGTFRGESYDR